MAVACNINKNSNKYRTLKDMSGISDKMFEINVSGYMNKYGRFPELDEIPNANSETYIKNILKIKSLNKTNYTNIENILSYTNSENVDEANIKLNNIFRDKIIELTQIGNTVLVDIKSRPSEYDLNPLNIKETPDLINMKVSINNMLNKMRKLYGVEIIPITSEELSSPEWSELIGESITADGFIYNNNIYINTDIMNKDTKLHELVHLFLGSIKFTNPELYYEFVNQAENLPNRDYLAKRFRNRSRSDVNEELFINEFTKLINGENNYFQDTHLLMYEVYRTLDSILNGEKSVKSVSNVFSKSLQTLSRLVGSDLLDISPATSIDLANIHRSLANTKEELFKNGELLENCE